MSVARGRLYAALALTLLATALRVVWVLKVPTIAVGDFAMYRESAHYLAEHGRLDSGFIYMPGLVLLLAAVHALGGEILAAKLLGALFGGLAAAPLYVLTAHVMLVRASEREPRAHDDGRWLGRVVTASPAAFAATLLYAVWPAGIALASVVGTDVPAGALLLLAFALLFAWGREHPLRAAIAFGAAMGLAAYFRAVALPLGVLSAGVLVVHPRERAGGGLADGAGAGHHLAGAVSVGGAQPAQQRRAALHRQPRRHHGADGELPQQRGDLRALAEHDVPRAGGRPFLSVGAAPRDRPDRVRHGEAVDRVSAGVDRRHDGAADRAAVRAGARVAVLVGVPARVLPRHLADWFGVWRRDVTTWVDDYYLVFVALVVVGIGFASAERRWAMAVPIACGLMLVATYALFVAEPRYRVTTEMLLFPAAGLGLARLVRLSWRLGAGMAAALARRKSWRAAAPTAGERQGLALGALIAVGVALAGVLVVVGGSPYAIATAGRSPCGTWTAIRRWRCGVARREARGHRPCVARRGPPRWCWRPTSARRSPRSCCRTCCRSRELRIGPPR